MKYSQDEAATGLSAENHSFCKALATAALTAGLILGAATMALAAGDRDNNPPGPRGGPGTNWENPPGPRGGPGASPDPKPWRPWVRRRIHNAQQPSRPLRPWTLRRLHNAQQPSFRHRPRTHPRRRTGGLRRR